VQGKKLKKQKIGHGEEDSYTMWGQKKKFVQDKNSPSPSPSLFQWPTPYHELM